MIFQLSPGRFIEELLAEAVFDVAITVDAVDDMALIDVVVMVDLDMIDVAIEGMFEGV